MLKSTLDLLYGGVETVHHRLEVAKKILAGRAPQTRPRRGLRRHQEWNRSLQIILEQAMPIEKLLFQQQVLALATVPAPVVVRQVYKNDVVMAQSEQTRLVLFSRSDSVLVFFM